MYDSNNAASNFQNHLTFHTKMMTALTPVSVFRVFEKSFDAMDTFFLIYVHVKPQLYTHFALM